jgi:glycerate-2-kinase
MNLLTKSLRQDALSIFQAGIAAANPYQAVKDVLTFTDDTIEIALDLNDATKKRTGNWTKVHLIAFGKAACSMVKAAQAIIPEHKLASQPLAITNYENVTPLKQCEVIGAGHPLPDDAGLKAAKTIVNKLQQTKTDELVLILVSGGGSALIPYPAPGITLNDKIITTDLLLASGATINQLNCVRKHLSQIKGGYLAKLAAPADIHTLILSDVLGDELSVIASGPTMPDNSTFADAINILKAKNILQKTPLAVQTLLKKGVRNEIAETPKPSDPCFKKTSHTLIGSNSISLSAIVKAAKEQGYDSKIFSHQLSGEAKETAKQLFFYAEDLSKNNLFKKTAILSGGETTVTINGNGRGGRNQEMALAFAIISEHHPLKGKWTFLSSGTDGRDGPTDAAGGIVDSKTIARLNHAGIIPEDMLKNNDSYSALKKSQDLVMTGATGTNVADLQILLIQPE